MSEEAFAVILVDSTSRAVRIEKVLAGSGLDCRLVPVPRRLGSDCGVCVRVRSEDVEAAREAVRAAGIEIRAIHPIERAGGIRRP